jgi:hypothetical protein
MAFQGYSERRKQQCNCLVGAISQVGTRPLTEAESSPAPDLTICPWPWIRMFEVGLVEIYQIVRHMDGQWRSSSLI